MREVRSRESGREQRVSFLLSQRLSFIGFVDSRDSVWMQRWIGSEMKDLSSRPPSLDGLLGDILTVVVGVRHVLSCHLPYRVDALLGSLFIDYVPEWRWLSLTLFLKF